MRRAWAIAALALGAAGCATTGQINTPVVQTGCDHPTGWSDQIRATAGETWLFAQMAANAYRGPPPFDLGPDIREDERRDNDGVGFAYAIYERRSAAGGPSSWVIAFRGTENDRDPLVDWVHGNLLGRQNARGLAVYDALRARVGSDAIAVTGHSLGGGIASHVSMCRAGVDTYVFNTSPRFRRCDGQWIANRRWSVVEKGEALKAGRVFLPEATQKYTSINCTRTGGPIRQHGIAPLAACLTGLAAWAEPPGAARASLTRNAIPWPVADDEGIIRARRAACRVPATAA